MSVTAASSTDRLATIARLRSGFVDALRRHVSPGDDVALIDFPNHPNVGDAAIWLGEMSALKEIGARLVYSCETEGYSEDALRCALGANGKILLHGGGNLGDRYVGYQLLRERIVAAFGGHQIIQLPQSMDFRDPAALERARNVFDAHQGLVLLTRERRSLAAAQDAFAAPVELCPDAAFGIGPLRRPCEPDLDALWLSRTDAERVGGRLVPPDGAPMFDWLGERRGEDAWNPAYGAVRAFSREVGARLTRRGGEWGGRFAPPAHQLHRALAAMRMRTGTRLLSRAKVVVTDRLHAHVLCLLLGIPHIAVDTGYGKIDALIDQWTAVEGYVYSAKDAEQANALVAEVLAGSPT